MIAGNKTRKIRKLEVGSINGRGVFPAVDAGEYAQLSSGSVQLTCLKPVFSLSAIDGAAYEANAF